MKAIGHHFLSLCLCALLVLAGCSSTAPREERTSTTLEPVSGAADPRDFRYLTLANGLQVLLVSDPEADRAAAAMSVDVGSQAEPDDQQGLAHFLEHMLFLGTEKFPEPDAYNGFISRHGGRHNAYTAQDHTNYFFAINAGRLRGALDRFSQFFIAPLFNPEYVQREVNAVHSEYQLQAREDGWRIFMAQKQALNPEHPAARFNIGSLETLGDRPEASLRDSLIDFYEQHYSADRMGLVIIGNESTDTLQAWAEELFSPVPRRDHAADTDTPPLFQPDQLPAQLTVEPIRELRELEISFPLPPLWPHYREAPADYIADLVGHEGPGSLHAWLSDQGWIEDLMAGASNFGASDAFFNVRISLTPEGLQHRQQIISALFDYLQRVAAEGIEAERFDEFRQLTQLRFNYREPGEPLGDARKFAQQLLRYPAEDVVRGSQAVKHFDPELISEFLGYLRPERALVTVVRPDADTDRTEPWFQVPYRLQSIDATQQERWQSAAANDALALPPANPYIPEALDLITAEASEPRRVQETSALEAWHWPDASFEVPRASLRLHLATPLVSGSAADNMLAELHVRLLRDRLTEQTYAARLAGLNHDLSAGNTGLTLTVSGFDDKLETLLEQMLTAMQDTSVDPERFTRFQNELVRDLRNSLQQRPYQRSLSELGVLLQGPRFATRAQIEATRQLSAADLEQWRRHAFSDVRAQLLLHGNLDQDRARAIVDRIQQQIPATGEAPDSDIPRETLVRLDGDPAQMRVTAEHDDAAYALYVQGREQSWRERARFGLLAHMLSTPYFNALRTDQQLGYVVNAGPWVRVNTPGLYFVVQSPVAPPRALDAATMEFLEGFSERLETMAAADYETEREGLLARLEERDASLNDRSGRLWRDLRDGIRSFDSRQQIADALRKLELADFQAFYEDFLERAQSHRVVTWHPGRFSPADGAPAGVEVIDIEVFKAAHDQFSP